MDKDGSAAFSSVVSMVSTNNEMKVVLSPSPFKEQINLAIDAPMASMTAIEINDINGHPILKRLTNLHKGLNSINIDILGYLAAVVYFLHLGTDQALQTFKLVR